MKEKVLETMRKNKWSIKKYSFDEVLTEWDMTYTRPTRGRACQPEGSAKPWKQTSRPILKHLPFYLKYYTYLSCSLPQTPLSFYW